MTTSASKNRLGRWLKRHSLTLVAALGGAAGVAYAAGWHGKTENVTKVEHVITTTATTPSEVRDNVQDTVQIALLLDTSGSMDGLINQARSHLWTMVDKMGRMTRVVNGKTRTVRIELALYEYGNDALSKESGFIRQVQPFTGDLDTVSEKLHALFTNGGSEYVGQAITTAVDGLQWSKDPNTMKFVFVAGNEEFDQGPISAAKAMEAAAGKDVTVQLIFCGADDPTWQAAAKLAKSDLMKIDQNQVAVHIAAPQDDEILRIGQKLNDTYIAFGAYGTASMERQKNQDMASAKVSKKVAIERMQVKGTKSYDNSNWDAVDAYAKRPKFLEEAKDDELPAEFRGKTLEEKKKLIEAKTAERAELQKQLAKLESERTAFIDAERKKNNMAEETSLESELMKTTKAVAAKKGYKF